MKPFTFESQDLFEQLYYSLARDAREEFYIQTMEKDWVSEWERLAWAIRWSNGWIMPLK